MSPIYSKTKTLERLLDDDCQGTSFVYQLNETLRVCLNSIPSGQLKTVLCKINVGIDERYADRFTLSLSNTNGSVTSVESISQQGV